MTDSVADILGKRRYDEPSELDLIRNFVQEQFDETPKLKITKSTIIIGVSNSALAGALRPHLHTLQARAETDKRLLIRIG